MELNLLKYMAFVKTVETGTFSRAAEELHYSQSGISRMIADLESEWKVTLLERGKNGVRLTGDGTKILPFAKAVCEEYEKLNAEVSAISGMSEGLVRIGTAAGLAGWLSGPLAEFTSENAGIEIELHTGTYAEAEAWAAEGSVDFALTRLPLKNDLESAFLFQDDFRAILHRNDAETDDFGPDTRFPVAAVSQRPFLFPGGAAGEDLNELFRRADVRPDTRYRLSREEEAIPFVRRGLGMTILPESALSEVRNDPSIRILPLDIPAYRNIGYAVKNRRSASLAASRLLDILER